MALNRISTLNVHQTTLREASRVQFDLFSLQKQVSSGLKADTFAGINGQVEQYTALDNVLSRTQQFILNNKIAEGRLSSTSAALDQVIQTGDDLKNLIMLRRNQTLEGNLAFEQQIEGYWKTLTGQLNTTLEGRYIFGGASTDTEPVDTENFPSLATPGVPDDGYYQGSNQDITVRVDENFTLTPNVRANDPAFQKIFAALAMAREGHREKNDEKLQQAFDLVQEGIEGTVNVQASVNANKVILQQANDKLEHISLYWTGLKEEILNTDIISASTQVAMNQGVLQAAFQVFARINSLQLSDYLR